MATPYINPKLYPQSNMENWNFRSWHVGVDGGGKNTNPITAESCLIAAGPPRLSQIADNLLSSVFPLGMIENVTVGQQKMLQQVREIGSRRGYIVSSFSTGSLTLSRVMYSEASLLRVMTIANQDQTGLDNPAGSLRGVHTGNVAVDTAEPVWYANLQAEIFDRPVGLLFYLLDQRNNPYGAMYAEDCMIQTHNFAMAAQGIAISEQVSMMFDRFNPVTVSVG
jgi:hypothetical protein